MEFSVKITLKNEDSQEIHRRLSVNQETTKLVDLQHLISTVFQLENFQIGYVDSDNDFISIGSDIELKTFLEGKKLHLVLRKTASSVPIVVLPSKEEKKEALESKELPSKKMTKPKKFNKKENEQNEKKKISKEEKKLSKEEKQSLREERKRFRLSRKEKSEIPERKKERVIRPKRIRNRPEVVLEEKKAIVATKEPRIFSISEEKQIEIVPKVDKKKLTKSVSVLERQVFSKTICGSKFSASWKIKNQGESAWKNLHLFLKKGENLTENQIKESIAIVDVVEPNEEILISVPLVAPMKNGRHVSFFKLAICSIDGTLVPFGPALKVVSVATTNSSPSVASDSKKNSPSFEEKIQLLKKLGFQNEKRILRLLSKFEGNTDLVLSKLQNQRKRLIQPKV